MKTIRLYGKNPVRERMKTNPGSIKKLFLQRQVDLSDVVREAKNAELRFESLDKNEFKKLCGDVHSQGVFAEVEEFGYMPYEKIVKLCLSGKTIPVFLDGITDPQNLGSIIRTLACLGGFSLVLPEHGSADVTETVLRVANGGENYIGISKVTNIATTIKSLRKKGVCIVGALVSGKKLELLENDKNAPIALVVGSEGKGIRPGVSLLLDEKIMLPMEGAELSYNAAVAAAIFCHEIRKKR
ncbi:MAG: RNA methyltransferase [Candidatus Aadella gelida]|nr:RNA methyltransferase [Candidatus Aadella gelida]